MRLWWVIAFVLSLQAEVGCQTVPDVKHSRYEWADLPKVKKGHKRIWVRNLPIDIIESGKLTKHQKKILDDLLNPPEPKREKRGYY